MEDIHGDYSWKWELLSFDLPESIKDKIKAIPIQNYGIREDTIMWKHTLDGEFSNKSAYLLSFKGENSSPVFKGAWIWKLDILPKITTFLWLCLHNSIPVKEVLASRGIMCDKICPLCKSQEETILHLLRDCELARDCWRKLEVPPMLVSYFSRNLEDWLQANCLSNVGHKSANPWSTLFLFTVWSIQKNRNKIVFDNAIPNSSLHKICLSQAYEYSFYVSKSKIIAQKVVVPVRWSKPLEGWYKLNTDGASFGNLGKAGGGGIIRDSQGNWVKGYSRAIGFTISIIAELWALRDGLNLAIQLGIQ